MPTMIEELNLATLTDQNAVTFMGTHEDGRGVSASVDVFDTLNGFAYGMLVTFEEDAPGGGISSQFDFGSHVARLPLDGIVANKGTIAVDVAYSEGMNISPSQAELEAAQWHPLEIVYAGLLLTDRAQVAQRGLEEMEEVFKRAFLDPDWAPGTPVHPAVEALATSHTFDEVADFVGVSKDEPSEEDIQ